MKITTIDDFLAQDERKDMVRLLTAGSVDDGKSTLIGRLLYDSKLLYEDQLQALERDSRRCGNAGENIDYALLCDGLKAEREQGITIDVAYRYFATSRRKFIIADTTGHEQYTRNMITGGSTADIAIILVDARQGILTQTCRHSYLISLLGIKHIVLAVNKMDAVGYSQRRFNGIVEHYLDWFATQPFTVEDIICIPLSALYGDNVVERSKNMIWYEGEPLLRTLESIKCDSSNIHFPFRFPVQYVLRPNQNFRGFAGKIASGVINVGDRVKALPSGRESHIKQIVTYDGNLECAFSPQSVTLTLSDEIDLSRGEMLVKSDQMQPAVANHIQAMVVWMDSEPLVQGRQYYLKHTTNTVRAEFSRLLYGVDVNTGAQEPTAGMELNQIAKVEITCHSPLICDLYAHSRATGSFIIIDPITNYTSAVGMIVEVSSNTDCKETITFSAAQYHIDPQSIPAVRELINQIEKRCGISIKLTE